MAESVAVCDLPPLDRIDSWLVSAIRDTHPFTNGLAIIIGCPNSCKPTHPVLEGAEHDIRKGKEVFDSLMFVTLCLYDPSVKHIKGIIKVVSELNKDAVSLPESWKRIVLVFSGHGDDSDFLYTRDGTVSLRHDIVEPLLAMNAECLALLPKLFFIDACRGKMEDEGVDIRWCRPGPVARGERVPSKGNYLIACSTMPGMKSFELPRAGGIWMQILFAQLLDQANVQESILSIMPRVTRLLIQVCNQHHQMSLQQPLLESTLSDDIKLLNEAQTLHYQRQQPQQPLLQQHQWQQQQPQQQLLQQYQQQQQWQQGPQLLQGGYAYPEQHQQPQLEYGNPHRDLGINTASPQPGLPLSTPQYPETVHFRGSQEEDPTATRGDTAKPKGKAWKSKLEEYFDAKGEVGKNVVEYHTKADGYGYKSTVICPEVGYVTGEKRPTRSDAEQSAAKTALQRLKPKK